MFPTVTKNPDLSSLDKKITPLVDAINKLGFSTYYSCEGHGENRDVVQSSYPMVVICLNPEEDVKRLFRLIGVIGIHNTNLKKSEDISWTLAPSGNQSKQLTLKPSFSVYHSLNELHAGIKSLVNTFNQTNKWYELNL